MASAHHVLYRVCMCSVNVTKTYEYDVHFNMSFTNINLKVQHNIGGKWLIQLLADMCIIQIKSVTSDV